MGRVPLRPDEALPSNGRLRDVTHFMARRFGRAEREYTRPLRLYSMAPNAATRDSRESWLRAEVDVIELFEMVDEGPSRL